MTAAGVTDEPSNSAARLTELGTTVAEGGCNVPTFTRRAPSWQHRCAGMAGATYNGARWNRQSHTARGGPGTCSTPMPFLAPHQRECPAAVLPDRSKERATTTAFISPTTAEPKLHRRAYPLHAQAFPHAATARARRTPHGVTCTVVHRACPSVPEPAVAWATLMPR